MAPTLTASLDSIVQDLRDSPLFQLSLAAKELFHSNFLAWFCETYSEHAGPLFATYLKPTPSADDRLKVQLERKNIDLSLEYPGGETLVIENKVKSIPSLPQLQKYSARNKGTSETSFLLLSLTSPTFFLPDEWQYLAYSELANKLRAFLPDIDDANPYHGRLLRDYIGFITSLDALASYFAIEWDNEDSDFFVGREDRRLLKSIRLHDVIDKIRYSQLAQRVSTVLGEDGFKLITNEYPEERGRPRERFREVRRGHIWVASDMTRGVGLIDLKYFVMDKDHDGSPVILGVQLQGDQFRLVVQVWDPDRSAKIAGAFEIATAVLQPSVGNKVWFDFGLLPNDAEEYPKKGVFNKYGNQFRYRSKRLGSIAPRRLVDIVVGYARMIRTNEGVLSEQIKTAL